MFSVLQPTSNNTSSWLLCRERELLELTLQHGIQSGSQPRMLTATEQTSLQKLPSDTRSTVKCDDKLVDEGEDDDNADTSAEENLVQEDEDEKDQISTQTALCGQPLFHMRQSRKTPIRQFAYQCLRDWIARLLCRPGIEDALDQSLTSSPASTGLCPTFTAQKFGLNSRDLMANLSLDDPET
ncbi:hypothetical protein PGT21_002344 [Puccinia graminis f. sp. tritici]|uniref:Uncharacterized protein n=1 Tax=Puccinia graminis f. sp. tritici TaxID=56615 RepID=A0A5B0QZG5_PUCGR|nr:hypothetical protein PGT21_002344 [Puccinia graminis f. sp. tritici]